MKKSIILWVISVLITIGSARFQRITGPSYPISGSSIFEGNKIEFNFERSHVGKGNHMVMINVPDTSLSGLLIYKRYKSYDPMTVIEMKRDGGNLFAEFPEQPTAGKVEYYVKLIRGLSFINLPENAVILRYRNEIPAGILLIHIIVIFMAMLLATRTGLEAIFKGSKLKGYVMWTVILLFIGGLVFGPIVQKYSFNEFWTGFPFGFDLTDNKTLIAFIGWIPALYLVLKKKNARWWIVSASILMLVVYMIPHSILGSEINYTKTGQKIEIQKK